MSQPTAPKLKDVRGTVSFTFDGRKYRVDAVAAGVAGEEENAYIDIWDFEKVFEIRPGRNREIVGEELLKLEGEFACHDYINDLISGVLTERWMELS
jgi:hypothetical protein